MATEIKRDHMGVNGKKRDKAGIFREYTGTREKDLTIILRKERLKTRCSFFMPYELRRLTIIYLMVNP